MFQLLGQFTTRAIYPILVIWVLALVVTHFTAPDLRDVVTDGEFAFLPETSLSRQAERLYSEAFPQSEIEGDDNDRSVQQDPLGSNVVIVISREDREEGLGEDDFTFVNEYLLPGLQEIALKTSVGYDVIPLAEADAELPPEERVVQAIWTRDDSRFGPMLDSGDGKSTLIVLELSLELYDRQNQLLLGRIESLLESDEVMKNKPLFLGLALSGSATVGRDMLQADTESSSRTDMATKILVVILLLAIYRAPLLAVVPLATVGLSVTMTMCLLRIFAGQGWVGLFNGLHVYVTVVVYGLGVDFCLFLIARYKEELDRGGTYQEAMARSVKHVGVALATSAATSCIGIGMLAFTEFGKFQQAGIAISFGIIVALCCALTFTPAFLVLLGRWVFWPDMRQEKLSAEEGWIPSGNLGTLWSSQRLLDQFWDRVSRLLHARPATVFFSVIAILLPLAVVAVVKYRDLSYGLLTDLPSDRPSVIGARAVQEHFPAGVAGPTTVLVIMDEPMEATSSRPGATEDLAEQVSQSIIDRKQELGIADVRSQADPFGITEQAVEYYQSRPGAFRTVMRTQAFNTYVSTEGDYERRAFRFDFVLNEDPFSRESITRINQLEAAIKETLYRKLILLGLETEEGVDASEGVTVVELSEVNAAAKAGLTIGDVILSVGEDDVSTAEQLDEIIQRSPPGESIGLTVLRDGERQEINISPGSVQNSVEVWLLGSTASIRDLQTVTDADQIRIYVLVSISVCIVLVTLLRKLSICVFLIVSVVFSFLVAWGTTYLTFWAIYGEDFEGLDWKVPIYLFTLLLALGEDYNILLLSRVKEEQEQHGTIGGILVALRKTGGIISSCGVIMAGTLASLMSGTLMGLVQLGFALSYGVLLDTFVIRPIIVPAWLLILNTGRLGPLGIWLGAERVIVPGPMEKASDGSINAVHEPELK